ncbi:MAG: DUF975 family protein [Lachnospiraceae bacterium]|nr:DUF975 family protein [Lachnospiraceae bacterium]
MNNFKSSATLKSKAKGVMLGKYGTAISAFLTVEIIIFFIQMIVSALINTSTVFGNITYYCIIFIIQLIAGIFSLGQSRLYMNMSCDFPYSLGDVFYGFTAHPDKIIIIQFLLGLMGGLCMVPAVIFAYLYAALNLPIFMLLISVSVIIGGFTACVIMLTYSQVNFLILDFPQYSAMEIMKLSKRLMKGYRGKLFYIIVSFLPLVLLSLVTCCVGYLWVIPYINATSAQFYLELIRMRTNPSSC